jgi:hypothetical protein
MICMFLYRFCGSGKAGRGVTGVWTRQRALVRHDCIKLHTKQAPVYGMVRRLSN